MPASSTLSQRGSAFVCGQCSSFTFGWALKPNTLVFSLAPSAPCSARPADGGPVNQIQRRAAASRRCQGKVSEVSSLDDGGLGRQRPSPRPSPRGRGGRPTGQGWVAWSGGDEGDRGETTAEDRRRVGSEPILEQRCGNAAEVSCAADAAVAIQAPQVGRVAVDATANAGADGEHNAGVAVVGAGAAVLLDPPAEL